MRIQENQSPEVSATPTNVTHPGGDFHQRGIPFTVRLISPRVLGDVNIPPLNAMGQLENPHEQSVHPGIDPIM